MNKNMTENTNNNVVSKEPNLPTQKVMPTPLPNNSLNQTVTQYNNQMPSQVVPSYPQNMQPTISQNNRTQPVERTSNIYRINSSSSSNLFIGR